MVIWKPVEKSELARLYELCRRMGAPHFLSAGEMQEWLHLHLDSFGRFFSFDARGIVSAFKKAGVEVFGSFLKALRALQRERLLAALREQLKLRDAIKPLRKPLQLIPKSLHPDVSVAC
jgi:hypothetical protein